MTDEMILQNLGVSEDEARVYVALLRLGGTRASSIAKDVGMKRTTIYPILQSLARAGLVNVYFRTSQRFYYAQRPVTVAAQFHKKIEAFENIIPSLLALEKKQVQMIGLRFIETKEELQNFYRSILAEYKNKNYRIISSAAGWQGVDPEFFIQYRKDRGRANIRTQLLLTADSAAINPTDPALLREYKYLPAEYSFDSTIDIFDDKILIVSPELSSLAVVIAIPAMVGVFRSVFDILWGVMPSSE